MNSLSTPVADTSAHAAGPLGTSSGPAGHGRVPFTFAELDKTALQPAPIRPEWILEGAPEARCVNLSRGDRGRTATDHWSCTKGAFRWHYAWDETVLFLEGEVTITNDDGTVIHGRPGTCVYFPAGTSARWDVPDYIRKIAFNQKPIPGYLQFTERAVGKLLRLTGLGR